MFSETVLKVSEEQKKIGYDTYSRDYIRGFIHWANNRLFYFFKKNPTSIYFMPRTIKSSGTKLIKIYDNEATFINI